uniref:Uncharacterized protein n=1 Tax=Monopterus albus TaxID=43700 RepID=A0A3Q3IEC1_MONAL
MCWLLVDLNTCRVVADLESIIREKFEFSRGSILNLFIEDCYLPHTESVYVVRDNDSVRVKVHSLVQVNGHSSCPDTLSKSCRKRERPTAENGVNVEWKEKKRKKGSEKSLEGDAKQGSGDERNKKSQEKHTEKKKKKKKKTEENGPSATPKPSASPKKTLTGVSQPEKNTKKPTATQTKTKNVSSSDSSSSVKIPPKNKPLTSTPPKVRTKNNSKSQQPTPVPESTNCSQKQAASIGVPHHNKVVEPHTSDNEEEVELVVRRLRQQPECGVGTQSWRSCSLGKTRYGSPGEMGRGVGRGAIKDHSGSQESIYNEAMEPSYHTDSLTNVSVGIQNGAESAPKPDYSSMPLLAAPPQVGQKIAFKLLELTENYTPEVSEYKEGKIVSFDPTTKQIELELFHVSQAPVEPGKFDLVYQNPDGSERVEYAVSRGAWVTERINSPCTRRPNWE